MRRVLKNLADESTVDLTPSHLPLLVAGMARLGLDRVRDEEDLYALILLKDKEIYVKGLIRQFLVHDRLPARLFDQPRTKTERHILRRLLCWLICGGRNQCLLSTFGPDQA
jgi:hypothetical protein